MEKNNLIYLFAISFICIFVCITCEEEDRRYHGPVFCEFSPDKTGQSVSGSDNLIVKETSVSGADRITVQMIKKIDTPVKINFSIVKELYLIKSSSHYTVNKPDGLSAGDYIVYPTTAQYGIDFVIETSSNVIFDPSTGKGSVIMAANELFAEIPLDIMERNNNVVYFTLEDSENVKINIPTSLLALNIKSLKTIYFEETFADEIPVGWNNIDKDGDGHAWIYTSTDGGFAMSRSYLSDTGGLYPENYLISPAIVIPDGAKDITLSYGISASAQNAYQEQYRIVISENPITIDNCREATIFLDWTVLSEAHSYWKVVTTTLSLQAYEGKTVYIGFLHGNTFDMDRLLLKDVTVYGY